jgi:hypothetical protein
MPFHPFLSRTLRLVFCLVVAASQAGFSQTLPKSSSGNPDRPAPAGPFRLWAGDTVPNAEDLPVLAGTTFSVIKPYQFGVDGYTFHHGAALAWHKGRLYASYGISDSLEGENLAGEKAVYQVSDDGGLTWSRLSVIEAGSREGATGISHGVLLSHQGKLWAFQGAFGERLRVDTHTRVYVLDESKGTWIARGRVLDGFWPTQGPLRMADGNWIMAGVREGGGNPAAVAISHGDDFTKWDLVVVPKAPGTMWGESTVLLFGNEVLNIARYAPESQTVALASISKDYGRTWTPSVASNLPMAAGKPYSGTLSSGHSYLIGTTTGNSGNKRYPLTIALAEPGSREFSRIYVIRHAVFPEGPGESHPRANLAYPYAVEHEGRLYVAYSNGGGEVGRVRTPDNKSISNSNSIELAVIPLDSLLAEPTEARGKIKKD